MTDSKKHKTTWSIMTRYELAVMDEISKYMPKPKKQKKTPNEKEYERAKKSN